jgi:hypothetical protein
MAGRDTLAEVVPDKGRMELMGHKTAEMTARYAHSSVEYKRQAVAGLPQFGGDSRIRVTANFTTGGFGECGSLC